MQGLWPHAVLPMRLQPASLSSSQVGGDHQYVYYRIAVKVGAPLARAHMLSASQQRCGASQRQPQAGARAGPAQPSPALRRAEAVGSAIIIGAARARLLVDHCHRRCPRASPPARPAGRQATLPPSAACAQYAVGTSEVADLNDDGQPGTLTLVVSEVPPPAGHRCRRPARSACARGTAPTGLPAWPWPRRCA